MKSRLLVPVLTLALLPFAAVHADTVPHPKHVVFVGFDGFGSAYATESVKLPNLRRLMAEGAWTMKKQSVLPSSTAVNWTSIFTAAGPEHHGFIGAFTEKSVFPPLVTLKNGRFPDLFSGCRAAEPQAKIGYVYEWGGMIHLVDTNSCDFIRRSSKPDEAGIPYLTGEKPRFMAFVFDNPDAPGHKYGWGSPEYNKSLEALDEALGRIVKAIESSGMTDDTVLVFTADHGGHEKGHGQAMTIDMSSPLVIWGKGIRRGYEIKTPVYSYDVGATMAALLGVKLPRICTGRAVTEAFDRSRTNDGAKRAKPAVAHPRHTVFIGISSWSSAYTDDTLKIPNLRQLMAEGAWTMKKQSVIMPWLAVNWASIFMAAGPEQHGFNAAGSTKSAFPPLVTLGNGRFPDVFALCRAAEPQAKIGFTYGHRKAMASLIDTNACDFVCGDKASDKAGIAFMTKEKPRLMAFTFATPYCKGWGTPRYRQALEQIDVQVGDILGAIKSSGMADDTVVIVTSDTGGDKAWGYVTSEDMATPLIIWGKGVRRGHELKTPVYSYDVGATMAALLGFELPQICTGRAVEEAFD